MFYRLISLLLLPFWYLHGWRHGAKHQQADYLALRLASRLPDVTEDLLWFHAASVGEVEALTPLARQYANAGHKLLFTSFTASGLATIRRNFPGQVVSTVLPIDFAPFCRKFLQHFRIRRGIIMETELWPELLRQAATRKIPLVLVNARLSPKSSGNWMARKLLGDTVNHLTAILCRYESDREQFVNLGASAERVEVIGNLKAAVESPRQHERLLDGPYLLLASTHDPEEAEFLNSRPQPSSLPMIVIAPRHPKRSTELQAMMKTMGINYAVRSLQQQPDANTEVYLADTLGELQGFMQHASVVIMGGSFEGTGGHNLYEPARLGCAIITGPSDSNVRDDISLLGPDEGIIQASSVAAAWQSTLELLEDPDRAGKMGEQAAKRAMRSDDVLPRYLQAINSALQIS